MKKFIPLGILIALLVAFIILIPLHCFSNSGNEVVLDGIDKPIVGLLFNSKNIGSDRAWYPGYLSSNTLRIKNEYGSPITITEIGMNISISKNNQQIDLSSDIAKEFLKQMKMRIIYQNPISSLLKGEIYNGSFNNLINGVNTLIRINKNDFVELVYTIEMDKNAQADIAGIEAKVDLNINVAEYVNYYGGITSYQQTNDQPKEEGDDIEKPHWNHNCAQTLLEAGIIEGYENGDIKPNRLITRAEAAVLIAKALKIKPENNNRLYRYMYKDKIPEWARGYVIALTKKGIFKGYPDKTFKGYKPISRQEMAVILTRAYKLKGTIDLEFKDKKEIAPWALTYVKACVHNQIIEGYPNNMFKPKKWVTRAESFTMICKLLNYHKDQKE